MIQRVMFIGAKNLGYDALEAVREVAPDELHAVVTVNDEKDVATRSKLADFRALAAAHDLPLEVLERPSELAAAIERHRPELCIVVGWYWRIGADVLHAVPAGFVGFHGSRLPEYRGGSPLVWALINGRKETAMTMFYLTEVMDAGDVLAQEPIAIGADDTIADVLAAASGAIDRMVRATLPSLLRGEAGATSQDDSAVSYVAMRNPEDGEIDWGAPAGRVYDFVRAQTHPYPGAFTTLADGRRLRVWSAERVEAPYWGPPGKVAEVRDGSVVVTCGEGAILLRTVEADDEGEVPADRLLKFGARLGP